MIGRLIGQIIGPASDLISEFIEDPDKRIEFEHKLRQALLEQESSLVNASRDVVVAEAQSKSWIARNWRPIIMLIFGAILANNYILVPWLMALGVESVAVLEMPDGMWTLLSVGIGGYVVGRTLENTGSSVRIGVSQNQVPPAGDDNGPAGNR